MHFRLSEGSTGSAGELEMPSDAFQRLRDSSFWSTLDLDRLSIEEYWENSQQAHK